MDDRVPPLHLHKRGGCMIMVASLAIIVVVFLIVVVVVVGFVHHQSCNCEQ